MAAGGATIGALRVVLGVDTADFDTGLRNVSSRISSWGAAAGVGMAAVAAAAVAAAAAIGVAMQNTIDDMDKLNKTSQKLGIPVEQLSALAYAADLSDVSFEALSKSVGKLSKNMTEAVVKPTGEAGRAFKALGVEVKNADGSLKSSDEVMGDIADAFAGMKDGAGKTAVAMQIFGKTGGDLIPLLNGGKEGLQEMNKEAKAFGAIVSTTAAKQAEVFNDNLTRLGYAMKGTVVQAVEQVLPTLVNISNGMVEAAKKSGALDTAIMLLTNAMKALVTGGVIVSAVFNAMVTQIATVSESISLIMKGKFSEAFERANTGVSSISETATTAFTHIQQLWDGSAKGAADAAAKTDTVTKSQKDFDASLLKTNDTFAKYIESQNKSLIGQEAQIKTFGLMAGAREAMKLQLEAENIARERGFALTEQEQIQLDLLKEKASGYALTLEGLQTTQSNLTPVEQFLEKQKEIQAQFEAGKISVETYERALAKAAESTGQTWEQVSLGIASGFGALAKEMAKHSKGWALTAKALAIFEATVNTYTAFTKALSSAPPPLNYALAAATLAAGMAKVAAIKSQSFAMGGFVSGAGSGWSDSIPAMLSNGEFVMNASATERFRPELEQMNKSGQSNGGTIEVSGLNPGQLLTTDMAIAMVEKLSQVAGFGYVIKGAAR